MYTYTDEVLVDLDHGGQRGSLVGDLGLATKAEDLLVVVGHRDQSIERVGVNFSIGTKSRNAHQL